VANMIKGKTPEEIRKLSTLSTISHPRKEGMSDLIKDKLYRHVLSLIPILLLRLKIKKENVRVHASPAECGC